LKLDLDKSLNQLMKYLFLLCALCVSVANLSYADDAQTAIDSAVKGEYQKAMEYFEKTIRLKPAYAEAHNNLGFMYGKIGEHQKAIECYEEAIYIDPELAIAHYNLGVAYEAIGEPQKALACYKEALRIQPDYPEARDKLGKSGKVSPD